MNMKRLIFLINFLISTFFLFPQDKIKNYTLNGYFQTLEMIWKNKFSNNWKTMNTITNRLDFRWYPNNNLQTHIGIRNIAKYGQLVFDYYPIIHNISLADHGKIDLTGIIYQEPSFLFYTSLDRINLEYTIGKFVFTTGRQRINWGINFVWNPNDIFNTFNYFDFDYIERPGCDAFHIQYYIGIMSSVEFAYKLDWKNNQTYAAMLKFNKWDYDFQFFSGVLNDENFVFGFGWAGQIKGSGFMGEASYFRKLEHFKNDNGVLVASITANHTFRNSSSIQFSALFNSDGNHSKEALSDIFVFNREISAKNFTFARYLLFGQFSFLITPLINADCSGIFNPGDKSFYFGPQLNISVTENIEFLITAQLFFGTINTEFGNSGSIVFSRLKWLF